MAVRITKQVNDDNITFTLSGSGSVTLNTANTYSDRDLIMNILNGEEGGENVFDENGNLNVPGDIIVGGHSSPIGWTNYKTNSTATAISSSNVSSWRSVKASLTLPAGSYVIIGRLHYGNHTTVSGTTNASAGKRSIRLCSDSSGSTVYDRTIVTGYITAGQSYYIETVMFRKFTDDNNYVGVQPYSTTAVTVEGGSVEAIRIS